MTRNTKIKAGGKISHYWSRVLLQGKLLDGTECQILLDTGATKSYMSKLYYLRCKTLHALPKFSSNTQRIQVVKWTICQCTICDSSNYRYTWT